MARFSCDTGGAAEISFEDEPRTRFCICEQARRDDRADGPCRGPARAGSSFVFGEVSYTLVAARASGDSLATAYRHSKGKRKVRGSCLGGARRSGAKRTPGAPPPLCRFRCGIVLAAAGPTVSP